MTDGEEHGKVLSLFFTFRVALCFIIDMWLTVPHLTLRLGFSICLTGSNIQINQIRPLNTS